MKPDAALKAFPILIGVSRVLPASKRGLNQLFKDMEDASPLVRALALRTMSYDHDKNLVEKSDLIDRLNRMLKDENPTVVASALASLMDIWERSESIKLTIDYSSASKIVSIMPDCTESVLSPRVIPPVDDS